MKAIIRTTNLQKTVLLLFALLTLTSCSTDDDDTEPIVPEVTLTAIDCDPEMVTIDANVKVTGRSRRWSVRVEVTVYCGDGVAKQAEFKVKYPWLPAFKQKTDDEGKARVSRISNSDPKPTGSVEITVLGNGDPKTITVDY